MTRGASTALTMGLVLLASCGSTSAPAPSSSPSAATSSASPVPTGSPLSLSSLPLGDGHTSTSGPAVGSVFVCNGPGGGGGASAAGPWIHGATWDATAKLQVAGGVHWSNATFAMSISGSTRTITGNDLPVGQPTGTFPVSTSDPAAAYDRNPNTIKPQSVNLSLPAAPQPASTPGCLSGGMIGILTNGVEFFDALDAPGRDALAHEIQDKCDGHPQMSGAYHYHHVPDCVVDSGASAAVVVGWALDGYPIVRQPAAAYARLRNTDLDVCHGREGPITVDGKQVTMYHYEATEEFPYTLGCYHGSAARGAGGGG